MTEYINITVPYIALALAVVGLWLSRNITRGLRNVTRGLESLGSTVDKVQANSLTATETLGSLRTSVYEMRDKLTGRSHFTELSVYINRTVDPAEEIWHIADTLSADRDYYEFYSTAEPRFKKRITIFAPLELRKPVLVGAILRKCLAPEIRIKNLSESAMKCLRERFPFKAVVSKTMILVGNQMIGSRTGSAFGHFSEKADNPYARFVRKIYAEAGLEDGETLEQWVRGNCEKRGILIDPRHTAELCTFLIGDDAIDQYLDGESNPDHQVGRTDIDRAVRALAKRIADTVPPGE